MAQRKRIVVTGRVKRQLKPELFVQLLVTVGRQLDDQRGYARRSPDTHSAAIEDRQGPA